MRPRPSSPTRAAREAMGHEKRTCGPGLLKRLDTSDVLIGDGPEPVAHGKRDRGITPGLNVEVSASTRGVRNHDAGSGRPVTGEDQERAELQSTAQILRRRRSPCQDNLFLGPSARRGWATAAASSHAATVASTEIDATRPRKAVWCRSPSVSETPMLEPPRRCGYPSNGSEGVELTQRHASLF